MKTLCFFCPFISFFFVSLQPLYSPYGVVTADILQQCTDRLSLYSSEAFFADFGKLAVYRMGEILYQLKRLVLMELDVKLNMNEINLKNKISKYGRF